MTFNQNWMPYFVACQYMTLAFSNIRRQQRRYWYLSVPLMTFFFLTLHSTFLLHLFLEFKSYWFWGQEGCGTSVQQCSTATNWYPFTDCRIYLHKTGDFVHINCRVSDIQFIPQFYRQSNNIQKGWYIFHFLYNRNFSLMNVECSTDVFVSLCLLFVGLIQCFVADCVGCHTAGEMNRLSAIFAQIQHYHMPRFSGFWFFSQYVCCCSYEHQEIALNCGTMLRECARYEALAKIMLHSDEFFNFFRYVEVSTFDIASDAFSTFKVWMRNGVDNIDLCNFYYSFSISTTGTSDASQNFVCRVFGSQLRSSF